MRKSLSSHISRRKGRSTVEPDRPDGRHAPGARARIVRRRTQGIAAQPSVVLDLTYRTPITSPELEAIERHLADLIDELLG
ncbi:hypothetical protein MKK88_30875 [Methylobacterium sp. E-005]|uniref:hypothetical protein n=1 Tax=Methylobacterium sp. E-005 TaxID=2836549 RepID=UPI001FB8D585|nr:hypothetical protein [Methylobacterium sp. E-005]MCJ2090355.1 hypothetical protein [Methylobacterium sp. E-005]